MSVMQRFDPRQSLRAQISFASGGIALLLSLALSYYAAEMSKQQIEAQQGAAFSTRAKHVLDAMDRGMYERSREIQHVALLDEIRDPHTPVEHKRQMLESLQTSFDAYAWIGICDTRGVGVVGTGKYLEGKDLSKRPWCGKGRDGVYIGDVHDALLLAKLLPNPSGQPFYLLDVAAPLLDKQGTLQGVLCGHIYWNWVEEMVDKASDPDKDMLLVSKDGLILSGAEAPREELLKLAPATMQAISRSDRKEGYLVEQWGNGKTYLVGYAKAVGYRDYSSLGWASLVRQDVTLAFAPAERIQHQIMLIGVALGVLFAWIGWLMAGRIAHPIVRISQAARRMASGQLHDQMPLVRGVDEVSQLSSAIHNMVAELTREIAQRKKAEEHLRLSATVFEQNSEAIMITDADHAIVSVNRAFTTITGYSEDEVLGKNPRLLNSGEQSDEFYRDLYASLSSQDKWSGEIVNRHKQGSLVTEWVSISVLRDEHDQITHYIAVYMDIGARKLAELALQRESEKNRALLRNASDGIHILDQDGRIIEISDAFCDMLGYTREEVIGMHVSQWDANFSADELREVVAQQFRNHARTEFETRHRCKDGHIIDVQVSGYPLELDGKRVLFNSSRDISERKLVLDQLRASASKLALANAQIDEERALLAARVAERTAELEYANRAKDSFLATMSHEIRTPLGGLLGMMELLELSALDDKQHELLHAARTSGQGLLRIVNDILDWSKIEAGKMQLALQAEPISAMFGEVLATYAQLANDKDLQLQHELDPRLAQVYCFDRLRLSQILNNFMSNAIKFTASGTVRLRAEWLAHHGTCDTVRFSVQDSGMGISAAQQARLFNQYEQGSADTARMYGGTGLGLAICRRLADLMGGELQVQSQPGVGSTFSLTVELPVASDAPHASVALQPASRMDTRPLARAGRSLLLLIVDDHPLNRMLLKQQLDVLGVPTESAESGVQALVALQRRHFDLIITDCHMPEMDGYQLTRRVRTLEHQAGTPRVPILAWTANVLTEEVERCQLAGMDDVLTKPTELAQLRAKLAHWLGIFETGGATP